MNAFDNPASLREALRRVAGNLWFTLAPGARALFEELDPERFAALAHNPTALLAELSDEELAARATTVYLERVERVLREFDEEEHRRTWWQRREEDERFGVAYFSCEFGLDESLPIYSGGLGVLAGDHLKSASDLGVPLVGLGLFYREGYFRQQLDASDWQTERYPENDPRTAAPRARGGAAGRRARRRVRRARTGRVQVWRVEVGRIPLYLLDTDVDGNPEWARAITDKLYGGDREHRLRQELVLGVGGVRAIRGLGLNPTVFHMNEGHSAFFQLERLRELVEEAQLTRDAALQRLRASTVFTTHTPVPAGNEVFDARARRARTSGSSSRGAASRGTSSSRSAASRPDETGFGLTPFALRTSSYANGVSALHGEVSREMWHGLWPDRPSTTCRSAR